MEQIVSFINSLGEQTNQLILWISGATGLSTGVIILFLILTGRKIVETVFSILKIVCAIAVIVFIVFMISQTGTPATVSVPMTQA